MKFRIEGAFHGEKCFPGLNDLLHEAERHPQAYNRMKRQYQMLAVNAIRRDLRGWAAKGKISLHYTFGEPEKGAKRDYDNIAAAGRKIINDALVKAGIIHDDAPKYLGYGSNQFVYTKGTPFIEVEIEEG